MLRDQVVVLLLVLLLLLIQLRVLLIILIPLFIRRSLLGLRICGSRLLTKKLNLRSSLLDLSLQLQ